LRELDWLGRFPRTPAEHFLCRVVDMAKVAGTRVWI